MSTGRLPTQLHNMPTARTALEQQSPTDLPAGYTPGALDICCGRGKRNWNHSGNVAFRNLIQTNVDRYVAAPSKTDKTAVVLSIVDQIRGQGACFLKQHKSGEWYDIGDAQAREKVGHSLRDQVTARQKNAKQDSSRTIVASNTTAAEWKAAPPPPTVEYNNHPSNNNNVTPQEVPLRPDGSFFQAAREIARRPSEVWSDFGGEEESRRQTLESTQLLESFGRRPSWLAMSFVDSAGGIGSSSLNKAMEAAAAVVQQEEEQHAAAVENPHEVFNMSDSSFGKAAEYLQQQQPPPHQPQLPQDDERRASAISMMSANESYGSLGTTSFSNIFRSSLRRSSVMWSKELKRADFAGLGDSASVLMDDVDDMGPPRRGAAMTASEMLQTLEGMLEPEDIAMGM